MAILLIRGVIWFFDGNGMISCNLLTEYKFSEDF